MPRPPAPLDWGINVLTGWWVNPCAVPMIVYFETLYHAVEKVSISLLSFGIDDIVRGYFRPIPNRSWRHGRKGRPGKYVKATVPETGEVISKWIPGVEEVKGRYVNDGVRYMWVLDEVLQKFLYHFLIYGIIDEFWSELNFGIISSPTAGCENVARMMRHGRPQITGPQGWVVMDLDHLDYQEHIDSDEFACGVGEGQFQAIFTANIFAKGSNPTPLTTGVRIRAVRGAQQLIDNGTIQTINTGQTMTSMAHLSFNGPALVIWEGLVLNNEADFQEATATVFQVGDPQH